MVGFFLVLLASFFFCFQSVIVRILFNEQNMFGLFQVGGYVEPTLENSFLLMFMRMVLVVPVMAFLSGKIYPHTWQNIGQLGNIESRPLLWRSLFCGLFLFLHIALLYLSIGLIETGIATILLFTYPIFTALFSWRMFGTRPSRFSWMIMALVLSGSFLTIPHSQNSTDSYNAIGVILAIASGVNYALYKVHAQKSFVSNLHPAPFTWISFATILVLSTISLLMWQPTNLDLNWVPLWIGTLCSAIFTLTGHLLTNFGIRRIGATTVAMISSTNPALTVILAWLTIQETLTGLQLLGVMIVTLSVVLLSREHC